VEEENMRAKCLVLAALVGLATVGRAELPPGSYDKLKVDADSAATILVNSVKTAQANDGKNVTIEAKVLGVERSKSGLKKGEFITITYFVRDPGKPFAGPRPIPLLEKDTVYPAFLVPGSNQRTFEPAAHGESFKMTPENR
jgi:hypothetical protein